MKEETGRYSLLREEEGDINPCCKMLHSLSILSMAS